MSNPYARNRGALQTAIAEQLAGGATLAAICAQPGMPSRSAIWKWTRDHPGFADLLLQARCRSEVRRTVFDDALAATIVARAASGERIAAILGTPGMPGRALYRSWLAQQAEFAGELHRLQRLSDAERGARSARRHARPFDQAVANRIYIRVVRGQPLKAALRADPAFPSYQVVTRWRREQSAFDDLMTFAISRQRGLSQRARAACTPDITHRIAERVVRGASLAEIARSRGMPSVHTLYAWKRKRPDFALALSCAREAQVDWCDDQILIAAEEATAATVRAARRFIAPLKKRSAYLRKREARIEPE